MSIKAMTGYSWGAVHKAISLYKMGGYAALKPKPRGRPIGSVSRLTSEQEHQTLEALSSHTPNELGLSDSLWTRNTVIKHLTQNQAITLPVRTAGEYLSRWGFNPQEANTVRERCKFAYPVISRQAKKEHAEVQWVATIPFQQKSLRKPSTESCKNESGTSHPSSRTLIISVNAIGKTYWRVFDGKPNAEQLIAFSESLSNDVSRKLFLIFDKLPIPYSSQFLKWWGLKESNNELEIIDMSVNGIRYGLPSRP